MIERKAWVLPEPDSPTTPTAAPCSISKLTSLTAATSPSGVAKRVVRPVTARTALIRIPSTSAAATGWQALARQNARAALATQLQAGADRSPDKERAGDRGVAGPGAESAVGAAQAAVLSAVLLTSDSAIWLSF